MSGFIDRLHKVKKSQAALASLSSAKRRQLISSLAKEILLQQDRILNSNRRDVQDMPRGSAMRDRLLLDKTRIRSLASSVASVAKLPDVLGIVLEKRKTDSGLSLTRVSVPLGVVGVIYESRPNVTIDLAALAVKSGNALVLKGGKESHRTNRVLVGIVHSVFRKFGLSPDLVYLVEPSDDWEKYLFTVHGLVDVLIPRGGAGLIKFVREHSRLPVIETGAGVCHTFVDRQFDLSKAVKIIVNAKTQKPSVCNALDTLVIHRDAIGKLLPLLAKQLIDFGVEIFADAQSFTTLKKYYPALLLRRAKPTDYGKEFLSLKMSIKTVGSFEAGLDFVARHTSHHSEAIVSDNQEHLKTFVREIDAAVVYENISTRFTDGGEFGMAAEVGVSTQKLHVRGPMGAQALTSYKWIASGKTYIRV